MSAKLTPLLQRLGTRAWIILTLVVVAVVGFAAQTLRVLIEPDAVISIVLFRVDSLDELTTASIPDQPTLREDDVRHIDVGLIADPFFAQDGPTTHIFFETVNETTGNGEIVLASGTAAQGFEVRGTVLKEPFHLSYPHVFHAEDAWWMVPESWEAGSIRLYRATEFPVAWQYVGDLVTGGEYVDATPFRHDGHWWMFAGHRGSGRLDLFHSGDLTSGWQPHPANPLIADDADIARPGGRVINDRGRLYRVGQDMLPTYGLAVGLFEITELTTHTYREQPHPHNPVLTGSGTGWNADGMHHLDLQWMGDHWQGVADGHDAWRSLRGTSLTLGQTYHQARSERPPAR